eukprot:170431-Chlamydomonas_euryale.AAC.1
MVGRCSEATDAAPIALDPAAKLSLASLSWAYARPLPRPASPHRINAPAACPTRIRRAPLVPSQGRLNAQVTNEDPARLTRVLDAKFRVRGSPCGERLPASASAFNVQEGVGGEGARTERRGCRATPAADAAADATSLPTGRIRCARQGCVRKRARRLRGLGHAASCCKTLEEASSRQATPPPPSLRPGPGPRHACVSTPGSACDRPGRVAMRRDTAESVFSDRI